MDADRLRTVLVTGASSGIGKATAARLAAGGFQVFGTARAPAEGALPANLQMLPLDVCDPASIKACVGHIGSVDVLVNNAAYVLFGAVEEASPDQVQAQFDTNLFGLIRLVNAVLPTMRAQRRGHIINISASGGRSVFPFMGIYCATKFALEGYSEALFHEVRPFGINVSLVEPGAVRTPILRNAENVSTAIEDYVPWRSHIQALLAEGAKIATSPERVASLVEEIICVDNPKLRYPVGRDSQIVRLLRSALPDAVFLSVFRRMLGLHKIASR